MQILLGDCLERLKELADNSVDSIVTDPPAGISFMGQDWDGSKGGRDNWIAWMQSIAAECLRVVKPGGHAIVWALPRTSHWTATAWENAGFEMRDSIVHIFGSGFPKSLNLGKAIDKLQGNEREVVGINPNHRGDSQKTNKYTKNLGQNPNIDKGTSPLEGWGTGLKPAHENWLLLRKPIDKGLSIAANVLKHGTGGLNIDGCRVPLNNEKAPTGSGNPGKGIVKFMNSIGNGGNETSPLGRHPANLIIDGSEEVVSLFPVTGKASGKVDRSPSSSKPQVNFLQGSILPKRGASHDDNGGSAARFFYCTKASKADRNEGLEGFPLSAPPASARSIPAEGRQSALGEPRQNAHPTVKNTNLMSYLCRLITPPNGIVLDPFMGSGSTGKAAILEGFDFIGIEQNAEFFEIAQARITYAQQELELTI